MRHVLISGIEWDDEGMGLEECRLPSHVVVLDVPEERDADPEEVEENLSELLSESFGFCHEGFQWAPMSAIYPHRTHAGGGYYPDSLGVVYYKD
jgi:hypothetical protein